MRVFILLSCSFHSLSSVCFLNFVSHLFLSEDPLQEADSFPLVFFQPYQELKELFYCRKENFCGNSPKLLPPSPKPWSCLNLLKCGLGHERDSSRSREVVAVQSLSRVRLFATLWTAAHQASLSFPISRSWLKLMSIKSVMPSNHLILCCPLLLPPSVLPSIRVFSNEPALHIKCAKYWSFSNSPSNEYSELISFRIDWLDSFQIGKGVPQGCILSPCLFNLYVE